MTAPVEWMTDIAKAADDLGYGIASLTPNSVTLVPLRGARDNDRVTIQSIFLSGDYLRRVLQPLAGSWSEAMKDPEFVASLEEGIADIKAGRTVPFSEVRS